MPWKNENCKKLDEFRYLWIVLTVLIETWYATGFTILFMTDILVLRFSLSLCLLIFRKITIKIKFLVISKNNNKNNVKKFNRRHYGFNVKKLLDIWLDNTEIIYLTKMTHSCSQQGRMNKIDFTTCFYNINKHMFDKKIYVHIPFTLCY